MKKNILQKALKEENYSGNNGKLAPAQKLLLMQVTKILSATDIQHSIHLQLRELF